MTTTKEAAVKVAVVQAAAVPFDAEACVDKAVRLIGEAAATGAKVIVFPEAFIGGYPKGLSYGLVVGARDAAGREEFRIYLEAAIEVPGPLTVPLGEAAAAHGCYVVMGAIEREHGTCYCTALFFGPDGRLLGKHRKLMPTALERMIWGFGDGSTLTAVDSPYGRSARSSAGRTTCRCCAWRCTRRTSPCTARRPPTTATPGCRRCATSPSKGAASC